MRKMIGVVSFVVLLVGCVSGSPYDFSRRDMSGLYMGMTQTVVVRMVGEPMEANKTTTAAGMREQWVYESMDLLGQLTPYAYLYFDNGVLTAIQN